jgi:DNA-binding YbaB/EbfC family protein
MGNLNKLMKQAQQMQAKVAKAQEELAAAEVEGQAGGGAVSVRMNGKLEVQGISIQPSLVDPEDVEMLEDTVLAALTDATKKAQELAEKTMGEATGGMPPGLF